MRNWVPLPFCDPNDILDLFAFKSLSNTSMDSLHEKAKQNLIKYINLKIPFNGEKIKNILNHQIEKEILDKIIDKFDVNYITKKDLENVSVFKSKVKQIRNKKSENNKEEKNLGNKKKLLGRKRKDGIEKGKHNKYSPDNIIKKIKTIFFKYIIIYINLIKEKHAQKYKENFEFKKLSYENYINNLKKDKEILLLNKPLKDFVSLEISSKHGLNFDFNRQKMEKILEEEKDNQKLKSILNMTFDEWIDIFTFKKKVDDDLEFNGLQDVLEDLYDKVDDEYFSRFIFYLFNYKNLFHNKKARKPKKKLN